MTTDNINPPGTQEEDENLASRAVSGIAGFGRKMADKREQRKEEERRAAEAEAERHRQRRQAAFDYVSQTCPLPITIDRIELPGGLQLFDDEFVVNVAKDWGITTKKLILTTRRIIHAKGTFIKDQESINLTDVADINYHKSMLLPGEISIETSGGHSITGLPFARKTKDLRNQLLELVNWAKNYAQMPAPVLAAAAPAPVAVAPPPPDKFEQLKKLAELHDAGVLTDEEFNAEKAKLLSG